MSDELKKIMTAEVTRYQEKAAVLLSAIITDASNAAPENQNHEELLENINQTLPIEPRNVSLYLARSACMVFLERFVEAHADSQMAVSLAPNDLHSLFYRALTRNALGEITGALADSDRVLQLCSDANKDIESAVRALRAEIFLSQNRNSDAFSELTLALEIDPSDAENHYFRSIVANHKGFYRIALYDLDFKSFYACDSKSDFYRLRAEAAAGLGYAAAAESDRYTAFLFENQRLQKAVDAAIRHSKDYKTAIDALNEAVSILSPHAVAEILFLRGLAKFGLNQRQALEDFRAARAVDRLNLNRLDVLLYGAKMVMMATADHPQIISECKALIAREIKRAEVFMAAAVVKLNAGKSNSDDAAVSLALLNAAKNTSEHLPANRLHLFLGLAKVWMGKGNYGNALLDFDRAIELEANDPERVVNYSLRSVTHGLLRNYAQARQDIETAISICLEMKSGGHPIAKRLFPILCTLQADLKVKTTSARYYEVIVPPRSFANEALQHIVSRHDMRIRNEHSTDL